MPQRNIKGVLSVTASAPASWLVIAALHMPQLLPLSVRCSNIITSR